MMHVLIVDPQFEGLPDIEQDVLGPSYEIIVWQTLDEGPVSSSVFEKCDALINCRSRHPVTAAIVSKMPNCKIVSQAGVGYNHIDLEACSKNGIPVCNVPDYGTMEVADHAVTMALALSRGIVAYDTKLRSKAIGWNAREQLTVRRIKGLTYGIVGLGRIGTATALRARAFETEIAFYDPYLNPGIDKAFGFKRCNSLGELLSISDILSLHTPLTDETEKLINTDNVELAKQGQVIVNTSRGGVVDLDAIEKGLKSGRLSGAGLDVLPTEPIDYEHPLLKAFELSEEWVDGKLIITPHAAFFSPSSVNDMRRIAAENVFNFFENGGLRSCLNLEKLTSFR